jgi:hypothetical protein
MISEVTHRVRQWRLEVVGARVKPGPDGNGSANGNDQAASVATILPVYSTAMEASAGVPLMRIRKHRRSATRRISLADFAGSGILRSRQKTMRAAATDAVSNVTESVSPESLSIWIVTLSRSRSMTTFLRLPGGNGVRR